MSRQMHANIAQSEFLLIPNAAHIASIEQEAVFNSVMLKFLKKHTHLTLSAGKVS
ncbi:MAG: hypothetical protein RL650_2414, partial [Pseudomonadota bacterium]